MVNATYQSNQFLLKVCNWPADLSLWALMEFYLDNLMGSVLNEFQSMTAVFTQVVRSEALIRVKFNEVMIPTNALINGYYSHNNSLLSVAEHFQSYALQEGITYLFDTVNTFITQIQQFDALFTRFEENSKKVWALSLNMTYGPLGWVPLLNDTVMGNLQIMNYVRSRTENAEFQAIAARWSVNATGLTYLYNIARVIDIYVSSYRNYMKSLTDDHTIRLRALTSSINMAKEDLIEYLEGSKMNKNFYL